MKYLYRFLLAIFLPLIATAQVAVRRGGDSMTGGLTNNTAAGFRGRGELTNNLGSLYAPTNLAKIRNATVQQRLYFTNDAIVFPGIIEMTTNQSGALDFTAFNVLLLRLGNGGVTMFDEFRLGEGAEEKFAVDAEGNVSWASVADGDGSLITGLNASALASGTVPFARLPAGVASDPNLTNVNAYASSTTVVPLQIILPSGMLTNGLEILDSAGTMLWSVGSNGTQRIFGTTNSSLILYAPDGTTAQISLNNGNITNTGILSVAGAASIGGLLSAAGNAAIIGNVTVGTGGAGGSWLVNGQIVLPTAGGVTIGTSANNNSPRIARAGTGLEYGASIELLGAGGARGGTNNWITSGKFWGTNGFGSFASVATNAVASTGWTNTYMVNAAVRIEGTAVVITIKNAAQTVLDTYTLTGDIEHNLQPGHAITAATGLTGTARPW